MTPIGWITIIISVLVGVGIGSYLHKRNPNLLTKDDRKIKEIIENPHLLLEKLKAHGKIYDQGKELNLKVGMDSESGKEVLMVEEIESKKAKAIQKKAEKGKVQSKKAKPKKRVKKK